MRLEKSTYLITALQGHATDMVHSVMKGATYEETLEALEDCFRDQNLAAAYRSQLNMRTQGVRESLLEFATAVKQLAYHTYPALPKDHIRRGAEDPSIKIHLLLGGEKTVNGALRQALELQAVLLAAGPKERALGHSGGSPLLPTGRRDQRQSVCLSCAKPGRFWGNCPYVREAKNDDQHGK
jgi:hypothetical protein